MTGAIRRPRSLWIAALGASALLAELLSGSGSHARGQDGGVQVRYACQAPVGAARDVAVQVALTETFPETGAAGQPVRPGPVTARVTLPRDALTALLPRGTGSVSGTASLTARVEQGDATADAPWPDLAAPSVPVPVSGSGDLELTFSGDAQPVTVTRPGDVTFAAGELSLSLLPEPSAGGAASAPPSDGPSAVGLPSASASETSGAPRPVALSCTPAEGQDTRLGTVAVRGGTDDGAPTPTQSVAPSRGGSAAPRQGGGSGPIQVAPRAEATLPCVNVPPKGDLDPRRLPPQPPRTHLGKSTPQPACVFAAGYANVTKQNGAVIVNDPAKHPGPMNLTILKRSVIQDEGAPAYSEYDHLGDLHFPDADATFLTFGFQPTTAKVSFESGPVTIVQVRTDGKDSARIGYYQRLRVHDVKVNGVPLDVGPNCRTGVVDTSLSGDYNLYRGGDLTGRITIPPFSGCGVAGEDLDPLFTAAISGPDNAVKIRQSPVKLNCRTTCPAVAPTLPPLR
ncbi:hypothetical protein RKE29_09205 [Streptomyces sp. B1866]|uniref:DUF6801 domain-containing protein n=1 Tax=Streptomyces sp. B1866 TaxID=3075431 RepID=UPI00288FF7DC|nr:DUF6801 domain-containing protein [Streptomyces sp. B1866]MDT3396817.1 hypothetical protein [Streptomyces sp. B1866]